MSFCAATELQNSHPTHARHDIDSHAESLRMCTTEVNGMTPVQKFLLKRGDRYRFGPQISEGTTQNIEVFLLRENREVRIAAKFRCAVQNAGLSPHEKAADPMLTHRRKDSVNRVRDQGNLLGQGMWPKVSRIQAIGPGESFDTTLPIPHRRWIRSKAWNAV